MARRRATKARAHFAPVAWIGGAASALLLVLGVNGTLAAWTTAIINNNTNSVAAASAVILEETDGTNTCKSTDDGAANSSVCSSINKYGGTSSPLSPGGTQVVTVTMKNSGTGAGALTLVGGTCTATGGQSATNSVCGQMQVKIECPASTPTYPATGTATLTNFAAASATTVTGSLAAGASISCTFTVTLPSATSPIYAGQTASQPITWTLAAA